MDNQLGGVEVNGISMIESPDSVDLPDIPDLEVSESSLSPLTSSLGHNLTIQEDDVPTNDVSMGIENTWTEPNCSASDVAIPLPPPPGFDEFTNADPMGDSGLEHGPFLAPGSALNNLFADTIQEDSVVEVTSPAGVCGLRNLGNTCFMAAGLQSLTATPPVLRYFLELQQRGDKLPPSGSLMAHFSSLLSKMWSGRFSVVRPTEFKQTLGAYHSQFKDYRQHDCQEFLALLLDSLHEQMNTVKSAKSCHVPATVTTANFVHSYDDNIALPVDTIVTASNNTDDLMDTYDHSPESLGPNSPNVTMAGSPRDLGSPTGDLDSTGNSPQGSPLNDDDETLDSEEMTNTKSRFIHNKMDSLLDQDPLRFNIAEISKKATCLHELYDNHKDVKTSNANFLVTQQECNNEIHYDSQKFPKENTRRTALDNANLTENHDFDNKTLSIKRIKEVNVQKSNCTECVSSNSDVECDNSLEKCNVKRMKLEDYEKNYRRDGLGGSDIQCSRSLLYSENGALATQDEVEADRHWAKHLRSNRSIIVDTFQGQFKSTVICASCKHVSVTYEPFMYLSVPLPHAMERQLTVTYIPANNEPPIRCVVSLNKQSRIGKIKGELLKTLGKEDILISNIALAEVLENHISKILDDNLLLRYVDDTNRSIYAFELTDPPDALTPMSDTAKDRLSEGEHFQSGTTDTEDITACTICLDESDIDLKKHNGGNNCNITICEQCLENYFKTHPETHVCPVCSAEVSLSSFTKINQTGRPRPVIRILNVPLVLRHDTNETSNNRKSTQLFGYPFLVRLPSRVSAKDLHEVIKRVVPQDGGTLLFVDPKGSRCSRCLWITHCNGCVVPETGVVTFKAADTLAVRFTENLPKVAAPIEHASVSMERPPHPLSLYDCLQAFSQSEMLDEHNPWFCPKCERNQCATKTLTVHRYPKYLIVYLKRFVFHECVSMKLDDRVTFPLVGLSVGRHQYDLYACVCHYGGVSAGHYTAYARNPRLDVWYHYNDEVTSRQKPQEEDYSNAYILFYSRQGTNMKPCNI